VKRRRVLVALVILIAVAIGGIVQPLLGRTRAAEKGDPMTAVIASMDISTTAPKVYGPVDQNAPLDFTSQPATVPHSYVGGKLYNVQALKGYSYPQLLVQMGYYTQALGVQCTYCHNTNNFAYDTPTKKMARTMILMVGKINGEWIDGVHHDYPNYAVKGAVGCATCHRGQPLHDVEWNIVPVQYLDWPAKSTRQAGFVVNSMYSVARSLGVNCLFCHNSADFVTLQYYPTNRIAHRMWQMVDAINHRYLPPDMEAITCYTCHHGAKWPSQLVQGPLDQTAVDGVALHPEVHENPGAFLDGGGH
jgi:hypothetical protein